MKVAVTGASGLIGSALVASLATRGHKVLRLVRRAPLGGDEARWDPAAGEIDRTALEGVDSVVNLAGENIAEGRWNTAKKARLRDSRVKATRLLAETLAALKRKPGVLVCASALGYYGDRGDEVMRESSPPAADFLGLLCQEWEAASAPASAAGIRVVHLRMGIVMSPAGGALGKMLLPFKMGAGGRVGSGRQYMSWIAIDDALGAIHHALVSAELRGPVNAVAPEPVTNEEFTKTLGRVLRRPTIAAMPAFAARLAFGEMADALLLASTRVSSERLIASGYAFRYPRLESALRHVLRRA